MVHDSSGGRVACAAFQPQHGGGCYSEEVGRDLMGVFQNSAALISTPSSMALIIGTHKKGTPNLMKQRRRFGSGMSLLLGVGLFSCSKRRGMPSYRMHDVYGVFWGSLSEPMARVESLFKNSSCRLVHAAKLQRSCCS